jgi:hypothetical protein
MTCAQARRLLSAYRRDDWLSGELEALGAHLAGCAACRRIEAAYRQVGEGIRQLPTITPPPSLRAAVFAAIHAEATHDAPSLTQLTTEETQPQLAALPGGGPRPNARPNARRRPLVLGTRTAIAAAAVLLFGLFSARMLPAMIQGFPSVAGSISTAVQQALEGTQAPRIERYPAALGSGHVTQALASSHWVAYVTTDSGGRSMLYVENRAARRCVPLVAAPLNTAISVRGVSDHWVLWLAGSGAAADTWELWASPLGSASPSSQALLLASSANAGSSAPALLGGVWIGGDTVLIAQTTRGGDSTLVRLDLSSSQGTPAIQATRLMARAQTPGHLLTDPSAAGGTYYWAEVWLDGSAGLRSDIWQGNASGQAHQVTHDGASFAPRVAGQSLVWVRPSAPVFLDPAVVAAQPAQATQLALARLGGAIRAQDLRGGHARQVSAHAAATSLEVAGALVIWRDGAGGQMHTYDLARGAPSAVDSQVHTADYAGANGTAVAWGQSSSTTINVYDDR